MHPIQKALHRIDEALGRAEAVAMVALAVALAIVAFANVLLRNAFDVNLPWIGTFYQFSMIWLALLGASAATRTGRHVNVDAASRLLGRRLKWSVRALLALAGAGFCATIMWRAEPLLRVVYGDIDETVVFGLRAWHLYQIIPVAFGLMAFRFVRIGIDHGFRAAGLDTSPEPEEGPVA